MFHILHPLYLAGLSLAAIPLIFHLLGKRRIKEIPFSSLFLLKEIRKSNSVWMRIKNLILLLLRILFIVFVVASFSHPLVLSPVPFLGNEAPENITILIDVSLSMGVEGTFNKVKDEVIRIWKLFASGSQITLITYSDRIEKEEDVENISDVNSFLNNIQVTYRGTDIAQSLEFAHKKVLEDKGFLKKVFVISDFQKYALKNAQKPFGEMHRQGIQIYASTILGSKRNLYFSGFKLEPSFPLPGLRMKIYPQMVFDKGNSHPVEFSLNGLVKGLKESTENTFFETKTETSGYKYGYFRISGDSLSLDNDFYFSFYVPQSLNVLLVAEDGEASYIAAALTPGVKSPVEIETVSRSDLLRVNTEKYDLLILYNTGMNSLVETRTANFLSKGGGVLMIMGDRFRTDVNKSIFGDIRITKEMNAKEGFFGIKTVDTGFQPLSDFKNKGLKNLYDTKVFRYYTVNSQMRKVIVAKNGDPLMMVGNISGGRIVLIPFSLEPEWTQLPYKAIFVPLLYRLAFYLARRREKLSTFKVGEAVKIAFSKTVKDPIFLLPDNKKKSAEVTAMRDEFFYTLKNTDTPGIYRFIPEPDDTIPVSVNVKEEESVLEFSTFKELKAQFPDIKNAQEVKSFAVKGKRWLDLFPLFLILSLLCITAELILENR